MKEDPIVQETREARARLLVECGGDLARLLDRLQALEAADSRQIVAMEDLRRTHPAKAPRL